MPESTVTQAQIDAATLALIQLMRDSFLDMLPKPDGKKIVVITLAGMVIIPMDSMTLVTLPGIKAAITATDDMITRMEGNNRTFYYSGTDAGSADLTAFMQPALSYVQWHLQQAKSYRSQLAAVEQRLLQAEQLSQALQSTTTAQQAARDAVEHALDLAARAYGELLRLCSTAEAADAALLTILTRPDITPKDVKEKWKVMSGESPAVIVPITG